MNAFLRPSRAAALGCAALVFLAGAARAEPAADPEPEAPATPPSLRYRTETPPDHFRALILELVVLGAGFGEYMLDKSNSRDFDLTYDWPSLRSKLVLESLAFDNNHFATNFVTHPMAGYLYYGVARANRLPIVESLTFATVGSMVWEYVGEWREQASINDLVVTPVSGLPVGESFFHLGALFQRSEKHPATTALSWTFGSLKNAVDALDDAEPLAPPSYDELGLPTDVWHRFRVSAAAGVTHQDRGVTGGDGRIALASRIVELPSYGGAGKQARWFDDGEVSAIEVGATTSSGRLTDFLFRTSVMLAGYYDHDVDAARRGHTTILGLESGFEYGLHDYDRDDRRPIDRVSMVDAGLAFEHALEAGGLGARAALRVSASFAGADAYALPEWNAARQNGTLASVVAYEGYMFALGTTAVPEVALSAGPFEVGGSARIDWFRSIDDLDREGGSGPKVDIEDRRIRMRAFAAARATDHLRLEASVERREREGRVGTISSSRGETSIFGGVDVLF